jgi:hypothetical protein
MLEEDLSHVGRHSERGMTKGRVTNQRVMISESYVQATPTFPNDHTQFLNSPDVSLN